MLRRSKLHLYLPATLVFGLLHVHAQAIPVKNDSWPAAREYSFPNNADIVTLAQPTVLQKCRIESFEAEQITCKRAFGRTLVFSRDAVQAVIARRYYTSTVLPVLAGASIAGGVITGAVYLAMLGPVGIGVAVPVAFFGLFFGTFCAVFDDGAAQDDAKLVYLRPGSTLQVAVR